MIEYHPDFPGFKYRSVKVYEFDRDSDTTQYVSDMGRESFKALHKDVSKYANDKTLLGDVLHNYPTVPVKIWGVLKDGSYFTKDAKDKLSTVIHREGLVVVKPRFGSDGVGVSVCKATTRETAEFMAFTLMHLGNHVVTEFLHQDPYAEKLWPDAVNTIRIFVVRGDDNRFFLARAIQRIGTEKSKNLDNWEQGGLSARIDDETGVLGVAAQETPTGLAWHFAHPNTGATIAGVQIPGWSDVRDLVVAMSNSIPHFQHIGWDVVLTEDGPRVLEINCNTGMQSLQIHGPLLKEPRVRAFYARHGLWGLAP